MHRSSPTVTFTVSVVASACRTALLTASRTTASAWSASAASTTDSGPVYCTVVRRSGRRELRDGFVQALAEPGDARRCAVQIEDRRADLLNDFLKVVDAIGKSLLHFGYTCPRNRSLKRKSDGEQALDDVIVEIRAMRSRSVKMLSSRIWRCVLANCQARAAWSANAAIMSSCSSLNGCAPTAPKRDQDAGDRVGGPQRQHQRRAGDVVSPGTRSKWSNRPGVR